MERNLLTRFRPSFGAAGVLVALAAVSPFGGEPVAIVQAQSASRAGTAIPAVTPGSTTGAPETAPTAVIRGRVLSDTGTPLVNAQLRISGGGLRQPRGAATDDQGRYEAAGLAAGRYTVSASKTGYVTLAYGQRRTADAGRPIEIVQGQTLEKIDFALPKGAVIVTRVVDQFGDPLQGVRVSAQQYRFVQGQRQLAGAVSYLSAQTNDRGEFRLHSLPPGNYFVSALRDGFGQGQGSGVTGAYENGMSYVETYYPGTPFESEAHPVSVAIGQEVTVTVPIVPARVSTVTGIVRSSNGAADGSQALVVTGAVGRNVRVQRDGTFTILGLLPGAYVLNVLGGDSRAETPQEYARMPVSVGDTDVTGVVITTGPTRTLRGRFEFDTGQPPANLAPGSLVPRPTATDSLLRSGRPVVHDDWTFEIVNLVGPHVIRVNTSNGWFMKQVVADGRDVTDLPIDVNAGEPIKEFTIVVTRQRTEVSGTVTDARGNPMSDYAVVLFSADRAAWTPQTRFIALARPDQEGRFKALGLPPGRYLAAAVDFLGSGEERNPDTLQSLAERATAFTLAEAESKSLALKLSVY